MDNQTGMKKQSVNEKSSVFEPDAEELELLNMPPQHRRPVHVPGAVPVTNQQRQDELVVSMTWTKLIFITVSLFAFAGLLLGTLYLGHLMTIKSMDQKKLPEIQINAPKAPAAAPATEPVSLDHMNKKMDEILGALDSGPQAVASFSQAPVIDVTTIADAVFKKLNDSDMLQKDVQAALAGVAENIRNDIKTIKVPDNGQLDEKTIQRLDKILQKLEEIALTMKKASEEAKARVLPLTPAPAVPTKVASAPTPASISAPVELSPTEKIVKLGDFAQAFASKFEQRNASSKKEWDVKWTSMVEARNGDKNSAANERLMSVLSSVKGKAISEVKDDIVYDACRTFMAYRTEKNMQFPGFFLSIIKEDAKTYDELRGFLSQAIDRLK